MWIGYINQLKSLVDQVPWSEENRSRVSLKIIDQANAIVKVLLGLPRITGPNSMKGAHDKYSIHFRDVLDPLSIELACLMRHYLDHRELEVAASMYSGATQAVEYLIDFYYSGFRSS